MSQRHYCFCFVEEAKPWRRGSPEMGEGELLLKDPLDDLANKRSTVENDAKG